MSAAARILFVSREPITRERNGSTVAIGNLLTLLCSHGAAVTVLVTTAASRSPRLFFRTHVALPQGCTLRVPGYIRVGTFFVRPLSPLAWARLAVRALARVPVLRHLQQAIIHLCGSSLYANIWDLTEPTAREQDLVHRMVDDLRPATVLTNYAFWGPVLRSLYGVHRTIVMHDLLAEHVRQFHANGLSLDCPDIRTEQEIGWLNAADTLVAMQPSEAEAVRSHVRGTVVVQPIALAARSASAAPEPGRCLFVGSNTPPNVQALHWLLQDVWPLVLAQFPQAALAVAGTVCACWTASPPVGVTLLGSVESLAAEHDRAAVCLVPLRVGSGLKIKLLEALAHGKAVVSTSVGVQGLEAWSGSTITVADEPANFADAVVALMHNDALRHTREQAATALVRARFSPGSADEQMLLTRLLQPATS